ncbi:flagellar export apparatus, cytoplasmic ATPase complex, FliH component [Arcobacter venerupis]|jgi:flagellar assembly protein FliH|uniref:Flagellar assembly protein FliH n=1 Tax=Arcobacter venerupis TaxID=1054033 RepID=A0AAE7BCH9_9BACT|nr:FliH/SctL family protein [Arcobacter venerupis]QKF68070.1 flagellar export apparatus, cytoplasmic ATPase complex, FliH component [Arcobacter venerupis]RWS48824.1 flagellar assembly protein FliH [Arcobacter venerupis]
MADNVYSSAKILTKNEEVQKYELGTFINSEIDNNVLSNSKSILDDREINGRTDPVLIEIRNLNLKINEISQKVNSIESDGIKGKDVDAQVVQAIKDLKNYAAFFEQATFQMETKLLKTSISIAQKIISIEVGENSSKIAQQTINHLLNKIKTASKVQIHLNPKDYEILKGQLDLEPFIELKKDANVTAGGVVIASDLGNFDGNIESKVSSMLDSLDLII